VAAGVACAPRCRCRASIGRGHRLARPLSALACHSEAARRPAGFSGRSPACQLPRRASTGTPRGRTLPHDRPPSVRFPVAPRRRKSPLAATRARSPRLALEATPSDSPGRPVRAPARPGSRAVPVGCSGRPASVATSSSPRSPASIASSSATPPERPPAPPARLAAPSRQRCALPHPFGHACSLGAHLFDPRMTTFLKCRLGVASAAVSSKERPADTGVLARVRRAGVASVERGANATSDRHTTSRDGLDCV